MFCAHFFSVLSSWNWISCIREVCAITKTTPVISLYYNYYSCVYTPNSVMEEIQSEELKKHTTPPPLPPRPKSSILPPPVPSRAQNHHNSHKETNRSCKQKSELAPKLHRVFTTGAEGQIYDAVKVSPQLPLHEIMNKFTSDIPFRLSVCESIYGIGGENSLLDGELLDVHCLKETTVVHAVCTHSRKKLIIPMNSSIQCSVMYNPVDNNEVAEIGFSFPTTSHLFKSHPLPQVVAVDKGFAGKKKVSSFFEGEVLVLRGFDGRKKLRCISIPSKELKVLRESMKISFTTNVLKIKLYLSEVVEYLNFPVKAKIFHTEKNIQQQIRNPHTLTMVSSEQSLVASYHSRPGSIVEILANVPISFELIELEEDDRQQLFEKSKTILETFHPSHIKEVITDVSATKNKVQTAAFQCVQNGEAWKNGVTLTLKAMVYPTQSMSLCSSQHLDSSEEYTYLSSVLPVTNNRASIPLQKNNSYQQIDHSLSDSTALYDDPDILKQVTKSDSIQEELLQLQRSNSILTQYVKDLRQKVDGG